MKPSSQNLISVIIVSWNVSGSLKKCLLSLQKSGYKDLEIIVIDNNSSDDSVQVANSVPGVKVIANSDNIGFPKAVNQGIRQAKGAYVLLLNPDTEVKSGFFDMAVEYMRKNPQTGVLGPKFVNPDGTPQGSVFPEPSLTAAISQYWFGGKSTSDKYVPESKTPVQVNAISGGAMFIPKTTIKTVGLLTEKVFMYYEDLDYCRRVRNAGLEVVFHPGLEVVHEHGQSSKKSSKSYQYLVASSKWYNGWFKHSLMTAIIWSGQKKQRLFGATPDNKT